jgi:TonB family protein
MLFSPTKSASSFFLFFFMVLTAEASCFLKDQLYRMQSSSLEDIQTFLKSEGWESSSQSLVAETTSGFGFKKSVFTKNEGEKVVVYSAVTYGNIIHLQLSIDCFQTISTSEFSTLNPKLLGDQNKVIKEYQVANQIVQLVEYGGSDETNPEILIFNEDLKSQVDAVEQLFRATPETTREATETSNPTSIASGTTNEVFDVVETKPNPAGGMAGWNKYLSENLRYPEDAQSQGIEGTVIVAFVVNTDGAVSDIEILRGIGGGCDEEVIRIVKGSPNWTPGMAGGKPVRSRMRLPLRFKLAEPVPSGNSANPEFRPVALLSATDGQDPSQENAEVFFDEQDTPPTPIGGTEAWQRHLSENLTYPMSARMRGIQGTVLVSFIVNTDGTVEQVELVRGIGGGCDEEALRIIKISPRWSPGMIKGKAVRTRMTLPTRFKLG